MKKIYLLAILATVLISCESSDVIPPNIVWITTEDISPALGAYGDDYAYTPTLDQLAEEGVLYEKAYATAPICAPARSCLITGMYATSLGTQHLRSEIPIPDSLLILPQYLKQAGYYTTNNSKTDYNFDPSGRWDENGSEAHWRNRPKGQPFFSVFNFGTTHEGNTNSDNKEILEGLTHPHNPEQAQLPPYFPNTVEMRKVWARAYDLISVLDLQVANLIQELKDEGVYDNTIIFFFSDHGFGLPRYKRWMYNSGVQVPLIIRIPEKYQNLSDWQPGSKTNQIVSFVDFAPTVLNLTGIDVPAYMQGTPFMGHKDYDPRTMAFGARSRADDVYDMSRAVIDSQYIYIRNFMPFLPYIQKARIFSDHKGSFRELQRLRENGELEGYAQNFWQPKPVEAFFDLSKDPYELNNLINSAEYQELIAQRRKELQDWMINTHDTGLLPEAEMMLRAQGTSVYEMAQSELDPATILAAADQVGKISQVEKLAQQLDHPDSGVRFWTIMAIQNDLNQVSALQKELLERLQDESPSVAIAAATALILAEQEVKPEYKATLKKYLQMRDQPTVVLQAAIAVRRIGALAEPMVPVVNMEYELYKGSVWGKYKSWSYPMFIGMAFDQILVNCGREIIERS
ncbi:MAG: sulfatase-like hydrolase/transferase [Candidatus Cyclobacteriaceae bacterium M3_2C_046]